jgi:hypothetical protein
MSVKFASTAMLLKDVYLYIYIYIYKIRLKVVLVNFNST